MARVDQPMAAMSQSTGIGHRDAVDVRGQRNRVTPLETYRSEVNHDNNNVTEGHPMFPSVLGMCGECFDA